MAPNEELTQLPELDNPEFVEIKEPTQEQLELAKVLRTNPRFVRMQRKIEAEVRNMENAHPTMEPGERLRLATKIVLHKMNK